MSRNPSWHANPPELPHGGRLRAAAAHYGIALADWLDLSTGINPQGWPVPPIPASVWTRLPEDNDGLEQAMQEYYGTASVLPVAGTQAAIQALPQLLSPRHVSVLHPSYAEHARAWQAAGHRVKPAAVAEIDEAASLSDIVVLIHPNNPGGERFSHDALLRWHKRLAARGGYLVVDEAFIDVTPRDSLAPLCPQPGLVVLRSLGKFFGLAGARVGFVCAPAPLLMRLKNHLGPWSVASPSRWVATHALTDSDWQETARRQLPVLSYRLATLLARHGLAPRGGCALFQWVTTADAVSLHERLARQGILTRLFETPVSIRFGLPATETEWARLDEALAHTGSHVPAETCT